MEWVEVKDDFEVNAKPDGVWTLALEYVRAPALVYIEADDAEWQYMPGKKCNANGDLSPTTFHPQDTILSSAPVGALIAKVGGSTAGTGDGRMFVVGKKCLLQLDQNTSGPLFLTINDGLSGMQNNNGSIKVRISIIPVPQVSSATVPPAVVSPTPVGPAPNAPVAGKAAAETGIPGPPIPPSK